MLNLQSIDKRYGRVEVLRAATASLSAGSLNVMIGPNGAGKSTLLRIIAKLERADRGDVLLAGEALSADSVGYLPQDVGFHPLLTVERIARFYADAYRLVPEAADAALVRWGLQDHAKKRTAELSGGLRQRLGLAVLSLDRRQVLLLDEPGLSLDPKWRRSLIDWLRSCASEGSVILVTTHVASEWRLDADQLLHCEGGAVVVAETGAGPELYEGANA